MKQAAFEQAVLEWWARTRIPLTMANIQVLSGLPRAKCDQYLDALALEGIVELDSDDDGVLEYRVKGSARSPRGPSTCDEYIRLRSLEDQVRSERGTAIARRPGAPSEKSVVLSAVLSFVFGPFGLFYAAPFAEALGITFLIGSAAALFTLLGPIGFIATAMLGAWYASAHNERGEAAYLTARLFQSRKSLPAGRTR